MVKQLFCSTSSLFIIFVSKRIATAPMSYKGCVTLDKRGRAASANKELLACNDFKFFRYFDTSVNQTV